MTDEFLEHMDHEPQLPENVSEMTDDDKYEYQEKYLAWLIRRIELGHFENFSHRDELNRLKDKIQETVDAG